VFPLRKLRKKRGAPLEEVVLFIIFLPNLEKKTRRRIRRKGDLSSDSTHKGKKE